MLLEEQTHTALLLLSKRKKGLENVHQSALCTGSCKFADCPVRFIVDAMSFVKCDPPRQLKSSVHFSSKYVRHDKTKTRFRWIHSVDRQCIATDLKYQLYIIQSLLNRLLRPALESGQRDGTDTS